MKTLRPSWMALGLAAALLSSCGRASYSFRSNAPAYLGPAPVAAAAPARPAPAADPVASPPRAVAPVAAAPVSPAGPAALHRPVPAAVGAPVAGAYEVPARKPSLGQRLLLRRVLKQAARATTPAQNTARIAELPTPTGTTLLLGIAGLAALVIGLIVSSGFLATVGGIALVVAIVLYLLKTL